MSQTWACIRKEQNQKGNSSDLQSCIDVGQIMEKIQRDNYIRQQKSIEKTEGVANNLMDWKKTNDSDMKSLKDQIELLRKRKEQIRQNSTEMTMLANQLRQRLLKIREAKRDQQPFGENENMQC